MKKKCAECGVCCQLFAINLNKKEYESGIYKTMFKSFKLSGDFSELSKNGANILAQNKNGGCGYLKNDLCSIHLQRPQACRNFFCSSKNKKFSEMRRMIKEKLDTL